MPPAKVKDLAKSGKYKIDETVVTAEDKSGKKHELKLYHKWAVRTPRPVKQRLDPTVPLITGQRVLDSLFPISKGGTGAIPGASGTGKCVAAGTPILLGDGQLIAIDELYNRLAPERKPEDDFDEQFIEARGALAFSFDGARSAKQDTSPADT